MKFKRLTKAQSKVYAALRSLGGELVVTPNDARPLKALHRRGLIRYRRIDGLRVAILRTRDTKETRRLKRWKRYDFWGTIIQ